MENIETPVKEQQSDEPSTKKQKAMERTAKAHWQGNLKEGNGTVSTHSEVLKETNYSFKTRFEEGEKGTNPEELLAAAHAGCFTMQVAAILGKKGLKPTSLDTIATLIMEDLSIKSVHLEITGVVPGIDKDVFDAVTKDAEKNCMVSKALNITITSVSHFIASNIIY